MVIGDFHLSHCTVMQFFTLNSVKRTDVVFVFRLDPDGHIHSPWTLKDDISPTLIRKKENFKIRVPTMISNYVNIRTRMLTGMAGLFQIKLSICYVLLQPILKLKC